MSRGLERQLIGPITLHSGEYVPFTSSLKEYGFQSPDYKITYDDDTRLFTVHQASLDDYYITWQISLKTANLHDVILGLEFSYPKPYPETGFITRNNYILSQRKTHQLADSSIYHITTTGTPDELTIGLKLLGPTDILQKNTYTLGADLNTGISANIIIIGM